jgi:prolyl-tRNA editing enzyme YbaK/EbsC (Cys-tRNA(Pro) deacylase)
MFRQTKAMTIRTDAEQQVIDALDKVGVPYEPFTIDPEFADTAAFCEKYGYSAGRTCNTIIVASKKDPKQYCACTVLAHTKLDVNKTVTRLMGVSKASFASGEEMRALTGMQAGGVTPFSLPAGLSLYVDSRVMEPDWVIIGGGGRSLKIKVSPQAFLKAGAQVIENLAR